MKLGWIHSFISASIRKEQQSMALNLSQGSDDLLSSSSSTNQRYNTSKQGKLKIDFESLELWWNTGVSWSINAFRTRVRFDTLRPLPMFMGINVSSSTNMYYVAAEAFSPPVKHLDKSTLEKVKSRLSLNFAFFLTNYVLVALIVASVVALMHPSMVLFVAILYGLWAGHAAWGDYHVQVFGFELHRVLSRVTRSRVLFVLTALIVIWKCLRPTITASILSTLLIMSHAFLRDPKHIELADDLKSSDSTGSRNNDDVEDAEGGLYTSSDISESPVLVERPTSQTNISTSISGRPSSNTNPSHRGDVI